MYGRVVVYERRYAYLCNWIYWLLPDDAGLKKNKYRHIYGIRQPEAFVYCLWHFPGHLSRGNYRLWLFGVGVYVYTQIAFRAVNGLNTLLFYIELKARFLN